MDPEPVIEPALISEGERPQAISACVGQMEESASVNSSLDSAFGEDVPEAHKPATASMVTQYLGAAWTWLQGQFRFRQARKRLRVCESISLGEKRLLALVQVDGQQFLIGTAANSISVLAQVESGTEFSRLLGNYHPENA